jgi:hypothetical protein
LNLLLSLKHLSALLYQKKRLPVNSSESLFWLVVWGGIEPPTQGFSVLCSTN